MDKVRYRFSMYCISNTLYIVLSTFYYIKIDKNVHKEITVLHLQSAPN